MSWTILMVALCALCLVAVAAAIQTHRGRISRRVSDSAFVMPVPLVADSVSFFGLAPQDAAQFERAAQEDRLREQGQWDRDYLQNTTAGAMPGRVAGIPRALRVRT